MVSGAEAELCAAAGVSGIPLELLEAPGAEHRSQGAEHRAVTPAPGTVGINLDPIRPAVFATSIAARLGIEMPRVMSGTFATATIGTSQTAAAKQKSPHADAAAVATAGALTVQTATPKRVSARLELALEDIAAVGQQGFESILRQNLSLALSDELDDQLINGNGAAPNLSGMFQALDAATAPGATVESFRHLRGRVRGRRGRTVGQYRGRSRDRRQSRHIPPQPDDVPRRERGAVPRRHHRLRGLRPGEFRRLVDEQADAGDPGNEHRGGHPLPRRAHGDGRVHGHADRGLSALGRGVDRRYLQRERQRRALVHDARVARRRVARAARRLHAGGIPDGRVSR